MNRSDEPAFWCSFKKEGNVSTDSLQDAPFRPALFALEKPVDLLSEGIRVDGFLDITGEASL